MFRVITMVPGSDPIRAYLTRGGPTFVHGARHDNDRYSSQRRDPGRKKRDEQIDGQKSTHQAGNLRLNYEFRSPRLTVRYP
jgi:hypothetical protein